MLAGSEGRKKTVGRVVFTGPIRAPHLLGVFFCPIAPDGPYLRPLQLTWTDPLLFTARDGRGILGRSRQIGDINPDTAAAA